MLLLIYIFNSHLSVIILEFIFGMTIAKIYMRKKNILPRFFLSLGVLILFISIFKNITELNRLFYYGLSASFIIYDLLYIGENSNKLLLFLGSASYSIYLIHFFTLAIFYKLSSKYLIFINSDFLIILSVIFTVIVGSLFYYFVEKSITEYLKRRIN